jgi:hypothetical protein
LAAARVAVERARQALAEKGRKRYGWDAAAALILSAAAGAETYIGAAIGPSNIEANCDFTTSCDGGDTGFKIYGGFVLPQSPLAGLANPSSSANGTITVPALNVMKCVEAFVSSSK